MNSRRTATMGWAFFVLWASVLVLGPCLDSTASQSLLTNDPDLDGLTTQQEYNYGTDPYNSDTDSGGENDGSEVFFGNYTLEPSDDEIEELNWIQAHAANTAVVVSFDVKTEYSTLRLYRRLGLFPDYVGVNYNVPPIGVYTDGGLVNGSTYYYCMMAIDAYGHRSAVTASVYAVPSPSAIFSDGFESGDTSAWSDTVP